MPFHTTPSTHTLSTHRTGQVPVFFVATAARPSPGERREHCKITADLAEWLGIPASLPEPYQVRVGITRQDVEAAANGAYGELEGSAAVFTVGEIIAGSRRLEIYPSSGSGAGDGGTYRLFAGGGIPVDARVTLWNAAPTATRIDGAEPRSLAEPLPGQSGFREVVETGNPADAPELVIAAPHGGSIEIATSDQLALLKRQLSSLGVAPAVWDCRGEWSGGQSFERWHIAADDIQRSSFPGLDHLMTVFPPFAHAVALHGFRWGPRDDDRRQDRRGIVLGGRAPIATKLAVRQAIEVELGIRGLIAFYLADESAGDRSFPGFDGDLADLDGVPALRGTGARNVVNRLSPSGLHVEQSRGVRESPILAAKVAAGVARAFDDLAAWNPPLGMAAGEADASFALPPAA